MSRLPLRLRLTLAFAIAMAVVIAVLGAFLYVELRATLDEQIDQNLRTRASAVEALAPGFRMVNDEGFAEVVVRPRGAIITPDELARARQEPDGIFLARDGAPGVDSGPVRIFARPGDRGVVVVGASLDDRDEALTSFVRRLGLGGPIALLLASIAGYLLAGATLRPVEAMRRRAAEISATVDGRRLPEPAGDDEIARLARTLNAMLARLEAGLERERRFAAEASHELRTPLASLRAELELALRRPRTNEELRAAIGSAAEETDRLTVLAEDLLVLARSDEGALRLERQPLAAGELLDSVAGRFAARAGDAGVELEVDAPAGLEAVGDRARLEQALGNLVDNALRHGAGPVRLEAERANGSVALRVSDAGAGFADDMLPRAFERFSRADGARSGSGAGLGLAIVAAIAQAHGGRASAANRPGGGAEVTLVLPVSPPS